MEKSSAGGGNLKTLRSLRTLRALRPLRAVSRWDGMKVRKGWCSGNQIVSHLTVLLLCISLTFFDSFLRNLFEQLSSAKVISAIFPNIYHPRNFTKINIAN